MRQPDIEAQGAGETVLRLSARSDAGRAWMADNIDWEAWQGDAGFIVCDHRSGPEILAGALADGLYVTLDGREPR